MSDLMLIEPLKVVFIDNMSCCLLSFIIGLTFDATEIDFFKQN